MSLFRFRGARHLPQMITLENLTTRRPGARSRVMRARSAATRRAGGYPRAAAAAPRDGRRPAAGGLGAPRGQWPAVLPDEPGGRRVAGRPAPGHDNQILGVVHALREQQSGREVVLVSKGHQHASGACAGSAGRGLLQRQDARGRRPLTPARCSCRRISGTAMARPWRAGTRGGLTYYRISGADAAAARQPVRSSRGAGRDAAARQVAEITGKTAVPRTLKEYTHAKNAVWGHHGTQPRAELALNLLMDPGVRLRHADRGPPAPARR